jgi:hypothetical protein
LHPHLQDKCKALQLRSSSKYSFHPCPWFCPALSLMRGSTRTPMWPGMIMRMGKPWSGARKRPFCLYASITSQLGSIAVPYASEVP